MNPIRSVLFPSRFRAAAALLVLLAATGEARAAKKVVADITTNATFRLYHESGSFTPYDIPNITNLFDGKLETGFGGEEDNEYLIVDFSAYTTTGEPMVYVDRIEIGHLAERTYSLYVATDNVSTNEKDWTAIAVNIRDSGAKTYEIQDRIKAVKYVFAKAVDINDLAEFHVWGYRSSTPTKISKVARSIFFRGGGATRGDAGFNGGHYSRQVFNGNFNDPAICNMNGTTELVIPTTAPDANNATDGTGTPWYVTEVKVAHQGNSKYSLYYTTEAEPTNILTYGTDPRTWTPISGASMVQEQSLGDACKVFNVNKTVTAVKYVFESFVSWTGSLAEVEVWAMNPDDLPCMHPNLDLDTATYTLCSPATCTENAKEECICPDCGKHFPREVPLSKLGHVYVATLTKMGRPDRYGSGYVSCARTLEDPDTGETTWSCDFRIDFDGRDVDFTTLGGIPINGVVQYTDLTAYSTGGLDGGIAPDDVMDGVWTDQWNGYWFAVGLSTNEYIQYKFGTTIELTTIEFSVLNQYQTVYFSKYDPDTGEETIIKTIPIAKADPIVKLDAQGNAVTNELGELVYENIGYQRQTVDFFVYDKLKKTFLDAVRMRIGDYVDPETGAITKYEGTKYGANYHTCIIEFHPWGTIQYAGLMTHPPTTIMMLR